MKLWDTTATGISSGKTFAGTSFSVTAVVFSPDGRTVASADTNGAIQLWSAATSRPMGEPLLGHVTGIRGMALSRNGKTLATGHDDGRIVFWDAATEQFIGEIPHAHEEQVVSVAFSPDRQTLVSGGWDSAIRLWNVAERKPQVDPLPNPGNGRWTVAFSPNDRIVASGGCAQQTSEKCTQGEVRLWAPDTGKLIIPPMPHNDAVWSVAFSPDGKTLVSGSRDYSIRLWNVVTGEPIGQPLREHEADLRSVAFAPPNGKTLASGDRNGVIILWEIEHDARLRERLSGHGGAVLSVAFSPDGRMLASAGLDKTIRLWDVVSGQTIGVPLVGHSAEVESVAFSPDGKRLFSGGLDGVVMKWDVDFASWQARACAIAGRALTDLEQKQYLPKQKPRVMCPDQLLRDADNDWLQGEIEQARAKFAQVVELALRTDDAGLNNAICWYGSIDGLADVVLPACQRAIDLAPDEWQYHDSLGLVRALTGNLPCAREAFETFIRLSEGKLDEPLREKRKTWIADLEGGRNPFDKAKLEELRRE